MNQKTAIIKLAITPKLIYRLNKIPINIPDDYILAEIDKFILKLIELQGTPK